MINNDKLTNLYCLPLQLNINQFDKGKKKQQRQQDGIEENWK